MHLKYKINYRRNNEQLTDIKYLGVETCKEAKYLLIEKGLYTAQEIQKVERRV